MNAAFLRVKQFLKVAMRRPAGVRRHIFQDKIVFICTTCMPKWLLITLI